MNDNEKIKLTQKQRIFCEEYVIDWNATRAAKKAGYSEKTAYSIGDENLKKPEIKAYISEIQKDLAKLAGISRLSQILEFKKIAYSNIAHLHNTWTQRKEYEELTDFQKAAIESIDTKVMKIGETEMEVEYVKIKLYNKQTALENINKMLGYNEAEKVDITTGGEKIQDVKSMSTEELVKRANAISAVTKQNDKA